MNRPSSQADSRDLFRPTADAYRRVSRILIWPGYAVFLFWPLLLIPKKSVYADYLMLGFAGFMVCVLGAIVASLIWLPKLTCPNCHEKMDARSGKLGPYCPECGAAAIESGFFGQKCTACNKRLRNGRNGRSYKIHYCTYCDAHVDDEGV
jgi:predicted RNA-binding Zn-ribbon protein involved in translation (DUF1610 family)